ncbi:hypothetical protein FFLO_06889 [Filobasidium floriforme]|uniref:Mid2 domain-containing protein n=1 Tax=Filobasidium floriforme TaxID=5210 RepID=A0A8K0NK61_9TREE|nr:hypothetical protein FFLO_06889 [Filobasidium floriforme]
MHILNIKPTFALLLALTATANVVTANMHHRSAHIHRRAEIDRRAGAAYNETDGMEPLSRSVELGHQASLSSAAAASSSSLAAVAAATSTSASEVDVPATTSTAAAVGEQVSSTSVVQTSTALAETDDVVTSTATAATTALAADTSVIAAISSSSTPSTSSIAPITSSTTPAAVLATTSTSTVVPTTSIIRSTVTPTQDQTLSSAASLVRTTARAVTASASVSAAAGSSEQGSSKLSVGKTAMIVIIVVASVIVGALAVWTIIRKWKLGPSKKFDERMQPLDFSPHSGMPDPFLEKTRNRFSNSSVSSADRQRRQFVSELDAAEQEKYAYETQPNYLHGVPSHDFTAPPTAGGGVASSRYADDYDYGYPAQQQQQHDYAAHADETVGGNDYADLRRGPSTVGTNFAGMGAGPGGLASAAAPPVPPMPQHAAEMGGYEHQETLYSDNPSSLGRPTQGEGPYFAASQARRY